MVVKSYFNRIKDFYVRHERVILPISFFTGMIWDNLTLQRIDLLYENVVFAWNIFLAVSIIILINAYDAGRLRGRIFDRVVPFLPVFLQFSFGNLFSGFLIFYIRSGSVFVSWPFFLMLAVLLFGNEFFKKRYLRLTFQLSVFFIVIFSYSVFVLPIIVKKMGLPIFLASGGIALLVIGFVVFIFYRIIPERLKLNLKPLIFSIGGIYLSFHVMYFANIIPPLPLSLKESGIYHSIERVDKQNYIYKASVEPAPPYLFFKSQSDTFRWVPGTPVISYSAVFSPTNLNVSILHRWSYFDKEKEKWIEKESIPLSITGGRDGGYRGYTYLLGIAPGKWEVEVITERNQVLGRRTFEVVKTEQPPPIEIIFR